VFGDVDVAEGGRVGDDSIGDKRVGALDRRVDFGYRSGGRGGE
jgi:hypothetical protein